jgi:type I restriction enzyme M protein
VYIERAIAEGLASIQDDGLGQFVTYQPSGRRERYSDPEEQVRAEFWAELIFRYDYPAARIGIEVTVPDRRPSDSADLVVFRDDEKKKPFAVIECKRDGISDAEFAQAVEQAAGNGTWSKLRADFVMVVAGSTRTVLDFSGKYGVLEREENIVADLPAAYGKPQEFKYFKGGPLDIHAVRKEELINVLRKCHQSLWGGGRLSPPAAFGEMSKLIFVKISDEKAKRQDGDPYEFQIKTHEPSARLAARIHALYDAQKLRDPEIFQDSIKVDDRTLRTLVAHLEGINLSATDVDVKGVAFERFMDGFFKGDFGQYFTPRELIRFAVDMLEPTNDQLILDPACGSGGFLLNALDSVIAEASRYEEPNSPRWYAHWHDFAMTKLFGIEINDEIARVSKMNMILHGDGHSNIVATDALQNLDALDGVHRELRPDHFDLVLTNPPFGATIAMTERPYLADFELGRQSNGRPRKTQKTEILFVERVWTFLKPGVGRAAIVLPDGVLTNASLQYVRDFMAERFQILAIVSLPQASFAHFGTMVKASLVFLRKRAADEVPDEEETVFMAAPDSVGYDAVGREAANDLPEVLAAYREFRKLGAIQR